MVNVFKTSQLVNTARLAAALVLPARVALLQEASAMTGERNQDLDYLFEGYQNARTLDERRGFLWAIAQWVRCHEGQLTNTLGYLRRFHTEPPSLLTSP